MQHGPTFFYWPLKAYHQSFPEIASFLWLQSVAFPLPQGVSISNPCSYDCTWSWNNPWCGPSPESGGASPAPHRPSPSPHSVVSVSASEWGPWRSCFLSCWRPRPARQVSPLARHGLAGGASCTSLAGKQGTWTSGQMITWRPDQKYQCMYCNFSPVLCSGKQKKKVPEID